MRSISNSAILIKTWRLSARLNGDEGANLRDLGLPPERTLIAVKEVMGSVHPSPQRLDRLRELMSLVAEWCVEEYYGNSADDHA
jgi:hypothetical protein